MFCVLGEKKEEGQFCVIVFLYDKQFLFYFVLNCFVVLFA